MNALSPIHAAAVPPLPGKKSRPFDLFGFLLRRGIWIGVCGSLAGLLAALAAQSIARPVYRAAAVLLVDPALQPSVSGRDRSGIPGELRDWTRTQLQRIRGKDVMLGAMTRVPPSDLPDFLREDPDHPANPFRLMRRIQAREQAGTYLIDLSIENGDPVGIAEILNAVLDTFLEKLREETEEDHRGRLTYLYAERDKITGRLIEEEALLMSLADGVENKSFLHEGYNAHLSKVEQIQRLYWESFELETRAKATLEQAEADREALRGLSLQPYADERVADNFGINRIEQWTYEQVQQMRASIDGLTADNEDRRYVEMRMEAMNAFLREYKEQVRGYTITNLREKRDFELEREVLMARTAAEAATRATGILQGRLDEARKEAGEISLAIFQASSPGLVRDQLRERLQALVGRIDDAEMMAKAPLPVRVDQRAESPAQPASSSRLKLALAGFVGGFGLVGLLLLGYELLDDRLRSSRELRLALGGEVPPVLTETAGSFDRLLPETPAHPAARSVRDLATRLLQDRASRGGQVYAVAGVHARCGATGIAVHLATALRAHTGPVLLLEWNLERPGMREMLRLPPGKGLESLLSGECSLEQVLRKDPERRLDVLTAEGGDLPGDFSALETLLTGLRGDYALIVVDAGAMSDDLARLACRDADGLVLVARWKVTRYRELREAMVLAAGSGVPAWTAVLNRVPRPEANPLALMIQRFTSAISALVDRNVRKAGSPRP